MELKEMCKKARKYMKISQAYFSKMAKRYGLIKEFRENGIL